MGNDSLRISQALPTVTCSKCGFPMSLDEVGSHVCTAILSMPSILESPPQTSSHRLHDNAPHLSGSSSESVRQVQPASSNAKSVLGRLNNIKAGPLDSIGMRRPAQSGRHGPIQSRDPRATMVALHVRTDGGKRFQGDLDPAKPSPPLRSAGSRYWPSDDDVSSMISARSAGSAQSQRSLRSAGTGRHTPVLTDLPDELYSSSLDNSGPYHHVSTKFKPDIFKSTDSLQSVSSTQTKAFGAARLKKKAVYGDEWEERGVESDSIISLLPEAPMRQGMQRMPLQPRLNTMSSSSAISRTTMPPRSQDSTASSTSLSGSHTSMPQPVAQQHVRPMKLDDWHRQRQQDRVAPPLAYNGYTTQFRHNDYDLGTQPSSSRTRETSNHARSLVSHTQSHARRETSSSLGTVLTTSTFESARSSASSASPISTFNYTQPKIDRSISITPTPYHEIDDETPKAFIQQAVRMPLIAVKQTMTRSSTDQSFDRLLDDIGSSMKGLEAPKPISETVDNSPSSNYSSNDSPERPDPKTSPSLIPRRTLGSPASLQSKETSSSTSTSTNSYSRTRQRSPVRTTKSKPLVNCRGCESPITGKSISSKDGKLKGKWHKACFACKTCHTPFPDNTEFYVFDDAPYCRIHYHAQNHSLCAQCGEAIEGECIASNTVGSSDRFHVSCYAIATQSQDTQTKPRQAMTTGTGVRTNLSSGEYSDIHKSSAHSGRDANHVQARQYGRAPRWPKQMESQAQAYAGSEGASGSGSGSASRVGIGGGMGVAGQVPAAQHTTTTRTTTPQNYARF